MKDGNAQKNIFEYVNYQELLRDLFNQNKLRNKKFSYRYFARIAGFAAPSFLKMVIDGKSALSDGSIDKIVIGFKFNKEEAHFFRHLVFLNQAKTADERQIHAQEILSSKGYRKIHPLGEAQFNYYAKWYFIPVRELVGISGFKEDYEWISNTIIPHITQEEAREALEELQQINLIKRDLDGKLVQSNSILTTPNEVTSSAIAQWHKEMMKRAAESIDRTPREKRDISSVTFKLSENNLIKAKEIIQKFRRDLVGVLSDDTNDAIYELNLQLFPLTGFIGGGSDENSK